MTEPIKYYTLSKLADEFNLSYRFLKSGIENGKLAHIKVGKRRGHIKATIQDVNEFLENIKIAKPKKNVIKLNNKYQKLYVS